MKTNIVSQNKILPEGNSSIFLQPKYENRLLIVLFFLALMHNLHIIPHYINFPVFLAVAIYFFP